MDTDLTDAVCVVILFTTLSTFLFSWLYILHVIVLIHML